MISLRFGYLYGKCVRIAEYIGAEYDPLLVRCEANIRLQTVIVLRHVDQLLCAEHAGLDEIFLVQLALKLDGIRTEEIDPLSIPCLRHLAGVAAIAAEQFAVSSHIEVNR